MRTRLWHTVYSYGCEGWGLSQGNNFPLTFKWWYHKIECVPASMALVVCRHCSRGHRLDVIWLEQRGVKIHTWWSQWYLMPSTSLTADCGHFGGLLWRSMSMYKCSGWPVSVLNDSAHFTYNWVSFTLCVVTVMFTALYCSVYILQVPYYLVHILILWYNHLNVREKVVAMT